MVQLGLKKHTTSKKQYMCRMMIMLCQWDFNEQIQKFGKIVSLYQRELFKKIPGLGTFCTQSINEGSFNQVMRLNLLQSSASRLFTLSIS
jgi:hypothetical protein